MTRRDTIEDVMRSSRRHGLGFWSVAYSFMVVMAFSAIPTPLYVLYQARDGFSTFMVTVIFAAYAVGVTISLFFAGHSSDWIGRRRALAPAIGLSAVAAIIFLLWPALPGLLIARVLSGFAVGVVTATATAYLLELAAAHRPDHSVRRAQTVAAAANLGGIGLGPLFAGVLAQWAPDPLHLPFEIALGALAIGIVVVALAPETHEPASPLPPYHPQRVAVPAAERSRFFAAALGGAVAFSAFGLFTALAPTFLAGTLHHPSRALAGVVPFSVFASAVVAQMLTAALPVRRLLAGGMGALVTGVLLLVLAVWIPSPSLAVFLLGGIVAGGGAGMLFKGSIATIGALAPPEARAEVLAGFFLSGYIGISVPVVAVGLLTQVLDARTALAIFAGRRGPRRPGLRPHPARCARGRPGSRDRAGASALDARAGQREPDGEARGHDDDRRDGEGRRTGRRPRRLAQRPPFRVVGPRPGGVDGPADHAAQRRARRRPHEREEEVADDQRGGDVHRPVVQDDRPREAEVRVALAQPQQHAGDREQHGEGGLDHRVRLLAGVEAALRRGLPAEPAHVVVVEALDLVEVVGQHATVAEEADEQQRRQPDDRGDEVDRLGDGTVGERVGQHGQVEDQPRAEHHEEGGGVDPVQRALGRPEAGGEPRARRDLSSRWTCRPRRRGHSHAAPSSRRRAP
jgi:MFS family permease